MAGLSLRAGLGANASAPTQGYATYENTAPMPGQSPTGPRLSTAPAFGYTASGYTGARTPMYGGVFTGMTAAILLLALWWSLPR